VKTRRRPLSLSARCAFASVALWLLHACSENCPPDTELHQDDDMCWYLDAGSAGTSAKKPSTGGSGGHAGASASASLNDGSAASQADSSTMNKDAGE
jgi:hypothetical protein